MTRFRGPGRRGLRDEVQSTWNVYDATRPITKSDLSGECTAPDPAELPQPSTPTQAVRAETHGSATCDAVEIRGPNGTQRFTLSNATDVSRLVSASDAELAALLGISEMDVREARKWARENTERLGAVTVTGIDKDTITTKH